MKAFSNHIFIGFFFLTSCISLQEQKAPVREAIFRGSLQQIWLATEKALTNYPIAESNIDAGILKTDFLRGLNCWKAPYVQENYSSGVRCNLLLQFVKMPGNGIRVRITKTLEMIRDFVSETEKLQSDGLEELTVLYRIDRELTIGKELKKQSETSE